MKKIAIGFKHFSGAISEQEVVIIGDGQRAHVDHVMRQVPEDWRPAFADFIAPMLEGGRPGHGKYCQRFSSTFIVWWKDVEVL